ncbi:hypothetical protein ACFV24_02470 [Nocardia fluminea]|uniref:hypothetical protein n=1 Tax=Nocardia fluminea TaxID=134984 RepID=UPI00366CDA39
MLKTHPARQQLAKVADELDEWDLESVDACYAARELAREANQLLEQSAEPNASGLRSIARFIE